MNNWFSTQSWCQSKWIFFSYRSTVCKKHRRLQFALLLFTALEEYIAAREAAEKRKELAVPSVASHAPEL
jgi:hypothetical protein